MVYRSRVSLTLAVLAIFGINIFHQALMFTALAGTKSKGKSWKATDSLPCTCLLYTSPFLATMVVLAGV